jgi:FG-GAP-like repeat
MGDVCNAMDGPKKSKRLESWKEIAEYIHRDITTAIRWEREKQLPVHRSTIGKRPGVFAYTDEIDRWWTVAQESAGTVPQVHIARAAPTTGEQVIALAAHRVHDHRKMTGRKVAATVIMAAVVLIAIVAAFRSPRQQQPLEAPSVDEVSFHFRDSTLHFRKSGILVGGRGDMRAAKLNRDGVLDLVVGGFPSDDVAVLLGKGDGTFAPPQMYRGCPNSHGPDVADLDGDGMLDMVGACYGSNSIMIWWGRGDGSFAPEGTKLAVGRKPYYVRTADLNGDGLADIVADSSVETSVTVLLNQGHRQFLRREYEIGFPSTPITIGDVNGDGHPDVLAGCSREGCQAQNMLIGKGDGTFQSGPFPAIGDGLFTRLLDMNHRDLTDLYLAVREWRVISLKGLGKGRYAAPVILKQNSGPVYGAAADFDGDGRQDFAILSIWNGKLSFLKGLAGGKFEESDEADVGPGANYVMAADFNGDGKIDLAFSRWGEDHGAVIWVLLQTRPQTVH